MSEEAEAILALAKWCDDYGYKLNARVMLISDEVSDGLVFINTNSVSSIQALRDIAIDL